MCRDAQEGDYAFAKYNRKVSWAAAAAVRKDCRDAQVGDQSFANNNQKVI
jgi:hypothetical protein